MRPDKPAPVLWTPEMLDRLQEKLKRGKPLRRPSSRLVYTIFEVVAGDDEEACDRVDWLIKSWGVTVEGLLIEGFPARPIGIRLVGIIVGPQDSK